MMVGIELNSRQERLEIPETPTGLKPVWEVSRSYRCPLIGSCFNVDEHRRILKKTGFQIKGMKLYEIHGTIMGHLHAENRVSLRVDNYLKHKYRDLIATLGQIDESEMRKEWQRRLEEGGFDGLFYLACIRRDLSPELVDEMFGEIHMMSHSGVNALSKLKRELNDTKLAHEKSKDRLSHQKQLYRELKKENRSLQKSLTSAKMQQTSSKAETSAPNQPQLSQQKKDIALPSPEQSVVKLQQETNRLREALRASGKEVASLTEQLNENKALNQHLQGDIEELIAHFSQLTETTIKAETSPNTEQDLESKRVLIVGGMTKIKHLYQHMIEMNGGQFEYHDGYLKNGHQNLDAKVIRSDIIICPVSCNSHNACNRVKRLCRKHKKPLKLLANASVSAISTALFTGEANLNAERL